MKNILILLLTIILIASMSCTIDAGEKEISLLSPKGEERIYTEDNINIEWQTTGNITNIKIELYKNSIFNSIITASTPNDGSFEWTVPAVIDPDIGYDILISDASDKLINDITENDITISKGLRVPAQWEEMEGVIVSGYTSTYNNHYDDYLIENIVKEVSEVAKVYIMIGDASEESTITNDLNNFGSVTMSNVEFVIYNGSKFSIWMRDFGPFFVFDNGIKKAIDFEHYYGDSFPYDFSQYANIDYLNAEDIQFPGGNFISNGKDRSFMTKGIYNDDSAVYGSDYNNQSYNNIDEVTTKLIEYLGNKNVFLSDFIVNETTHHIDLFAKMLTPTTFVVAEYSNTSSYNYTVTENLTTNLEALNYTVYRIPQPEPYSKSYTKEELTAHRNYHYLRDNKSKGVTVNRSYTNALIINNKILVPKYNISEDTTAKSIYEDILTDYTVVMIDCDDIIQSGGAIHCITKEVPLTDTVVSFDFDDEVLE